MRLVIQSATITRQKRPAASSIVIVIDSAICEALRAGFGDAAYVPKSL